MAVKPLNRLQAFLAKIAGEPGPDVTPRNVTEYYLDKIADSGSGGGGGGTGLALTLITSGDTATLDKTVDEITAYLNLKTGIAPVVYASGWMPGEVTQYGVVIEADAAGLFVAAVSASAVVLEYYQYNADGYPETRLL